MFPYPSGKLHMGHVRNYTIGDVLAVINECKVRTLCNPLLMHSLASRNAAIQNNTAPAKWTYANIDYMKAAKSLALVTIGIVKPPYATKITIAGNGFSPPYEKGLVYKKTLRLTGIQ